MSDKEKLDRLIKVMKIIYTNKQTGKIKNDMIHFFVNYISDI